MSIGRLAKKMALAIGEHSRLLEQRQKLNQTIFALEQELKKNRDKLSNLVNPLLNDQTDPRLMPSKRGRPLKNRTEHDKLFSYLQSNGKMRLNFKHAAHELYGDSSRKSQKRITAALNYLIKRGAIKRTGTACYEVK